MDLGEILSVVRARWYILLPMMLLAVGLSVAAFVMVPTSYQSTTTVSLLSSPAATDAATPGENNDNPFLNFNGSLVATADFLGRSLQSTEAQLELQKMGVTEDFEVGLAEGAQGPFLTFTVTGTDEAHVLTSTATIARYADEKLTKIQADNGVRAQDMVRMTEIIPPQKPEPQLKGKLKLVIAAGGGTTALALMLTFVVESLARARRRRQELAAAAAAPTPAVAGGSASVPRRPSPARQPQLAKLPHTDRAAPGKPAVVNNGVERRGDLDGSEKTMILPKFEKAAIPPKSENTVILPKAEKTVPLPVPPVPGPASRPQDTAWTSGSRPVYRSSERSHGRGQNVDRLNGS